jgi:hypothetical protein
MGIANLQTSTKIFAHGDPVNDGTVRTRSLYTSTLIGSVLTQGIGGREYWLSLERRSPQGAPRRWLRRTAILLTSDYPPKRKTAPTMSRPSLRITRHDDQDPPEQIIFEIWNPLAGVYEPMDTLNTGLFRLAELVEEVRVLWVPHDPRREALKESRTLLKTARANGLSCGSVLKLIGCTQPETSISRTRRKHRTELPLFRQPATRSAMLRRETSCLMQLIRLPWPWLPGPAASTPCTEHSGWCPAVGSSPFPRSICTAR